jgi:F420-0:gamma-glutamyl ligase-like protein
MSRGDQLVNGRIRSEKFQANPGKNLSIDINGKSYLRIPIKTHLITSEDRIADICLHYAKELLREGDILFVSEKIVAITQGRAYHISTINASWFARVLSYFVYKSPYGIGLGKAITMELAIREAGLPRILFAALLSAITKPFGMRGVFYKVAGKNINAIDGPCAYTIAPYNEYAKLPPKDPSLVAKSIRSTVGNETVIIDANDLGSNVLGKSSGDLSDELSRQLFIDNPLGQSAEQTPLCIVRMDVNSPRQKR